VALSALVAPTAATAAPARQGAPLVVYAASSLTDVFRELGAIFEADGGPSVTFNFAASTQLRTQLEQGAPADLFASADQVQMDRARSAGVIDGPDVTFATNRLVLIAPAIDPPRISGLADLARPGLRIVTSAPDVPIGVYTQTMLDRMSQDPRYGTDFKDRVNANVVSREANVRQIVAKVQLGEADAAVVYRSDVTPQVAPDLATFEIADELNTFASYPIAMVAGSRNADTATAFIELVRSPAGQAVLARWNFIPSSPNAGIQIQGLRAGLLRGQPADADTTDADVTVAGG
jgi:molybdate transport system substrate-binding protein